MRKINNTECINTTLHVTEIFTLAMEINILATRGESIYSICRTDSNNYEVAIITGLINLLLKEKRKGTSLAVQNAAGTGSIPGRELTARMPQFNQKEKERKKERKGSNGLTPKSQEGGEAHSCKLKLS